MPGAPQSVAIYTPPDASSSLTRISLYDSGVKRATDGAVSGEFDSLLFAPAVLYFLLPYL